LHTVQFALRMSMPRAAWPDGDQGVGREHGEAR
jgi:hypothetical protein